MQCTSSSVQYIEGIVQCISISEQCIKRSVQCIRSSAMYVLDSLVFMSLIPSTVLSYRTPAFNCTAKQCTALICIILNFTLKPQSVLHRTAHHRRPCKIQCTFYCHSVEKISSPLFVYVGHLPLGSKLPQRTKPSDVVGKF